MTSGNWERIIQDSWFSHTRRAFQESLVTLSVLLALAGSTAWPAAAKLVHKKSHRAAKGRKKAVAVRPPRPPSPKVIGAAGMIAVAKHEYELGNFAEAARKAAAAAGNAPILNDYAQYYRAEAEYKLKDYNEVAKAATQVFNQQPVSPLTGAAAAVAVSAELDGDNPKHALELVKKYFDRIPQPQGNLLLARCFQANGDLAQAAEYFQRVYYNYPVSREAAEAANALADVKKRLGDANPPVMPAAMLGRAEKLFEARRYADARIELAAAIPQLTGTQRDLARVRLGEADFYSSKTAEAFEYLTALQVDESEADAERLSYLIRASRKLNHDADVKPFLDHLEQQHPASPWRMDALIYVADLARAENKVETFLPLYRACAASFGTNQRAAWCNWRGAFESYRKDGPDAYDLLVNYVKQFPDSSDTPNAMYFLGRLAERKDDTGSARACYEELLVHYPNTYYATLAQARLKTPAIQAAAANQQTMTLLRAAPWPSRDRFPSFSPGKTVQQRVSRAQLLQMTGLDDLAEGELKFGARNDGEQQNVYATELAKMAATRGAPDQAIRYIKTFAPGYIYMPLDQAPLAFWKLAFPIPFRSSIEQHSREQGLDPFLVAALIRQESEFDIKTISHAHAFGLMQLLPATGSQLARHFGIRRLNSADLLTADRNIQLGTYFFRNLLNSSDNSAEMALASYNAGPSRAGIWRTWGPFREPAEFVETVPFHETRGYIQVVLRNADVYRRLYAGSEPDVPAYEPQPPPKSIAQRKAPVKLVTAKKKTRKKHRRPTAG